MLFRSFRRTQTATASTEVQPVPPAPETPPASGLESPRRLRDVIEQFLESAPVRISQINQNLGDPGQFALHAGALKSMSLMMDCKQLTELADRLEALGRAGLNAVSLASLKRRISTEAA